MPAANTIEPVQTPVVDDTERSRSLILIVEDDRDNAHLIARLLTGARYDFLFTSIGQDALEHARTIRPDAITLDLRLPDVNGFDLLQQLKSCATTAKIPVIVVSILADEHDPRLASAFATLTKPINPNLLRRTVAAAVRNHRRDCT